MNKYIEEYITRRKVEIAKEEQEKMASLINNLRLGKKEFHKDFPNEPEKSFPYFYSSAAFKYRYNIGEVSDEDYAELLKYVPENNTPIVPYKKMNKWYFFAIITLILGCIGGIILAFVGDDLAFSSIGGVLIESDGGNGYVISLILSALMFLSQIILLCKIEYNTRLKK